MQNDVLKNNIAPWQEKGRWFHGVIQSGTGADSFVAEKTDKFLLDHCDFREYNNNVYLKGKTTDPADMFVPLDAVRDFSKRVLSGAQYVLNVSMIQDSTGRVGIAVNSYPSAGSGTVEFWVFAIIK